MTRVEVTKYLKHLGIGFSGAFVLVPQIDVVVEHPQKSILSDMRTLKGDFIRVGGDWRRVAAKILSKEERSAQQIG